MSLFLLTFLSVYGGMNAYLCWKVAVGFSALGNWRAALPALCVVMMLLPFASRRAESIGALGAARALYVVSWCWMVAIFWFCSLGVLVECWNLIGRAAGWMHRSALRLPLIRPRPQVIAAVVLVAVGFVWGTIEAAHVRLRTIRIRSSRIPAGSPPIRIVHISDLHLSLHQGERHLRKVIALVKAARPDVVLSTGDLADSPGAGLEGAAESLAKLRPPLGKFACTGNHEFYHGLEAAEIFHRMAGFELLRGRGVTPDGRMRVVGVDDPAGLRTGADCFPDERRALPDAGERPFTVLLKHRPVVSEEARGRIDLQLSGHTHGGQVFPFGLVVRIFFPNGYGWKPFAGGGGLYVTRGAGSWGPPVRVLAPPEVALIIVEPCGE